MAASTGSDLIVRRPALFAVVGLGLVLGLGAALIVGGDRPATPDQRAGRDFSETIAAPVIVDSGIIPVDVRSESDVGASLLIVAAEGRLLIHDPDAGTTRERIGDLPLTKPLVSTAAGVVAVSRGQAVFIASSGGEPVVLGEATTVYSAGENELWLSGNDGGPEFVEHLIDGSAPGTRFGVGFGVLVHGVADSGLLLGTSQATEVVPAGADEVVTSLPRFAQILSVRGDVVVGTDDRCDSRRCTLIIVDAGTGEGGEWDLQQFRMPNRAVGELSPDASHLAVWLVDAQRNLAVGVIDLRTGFTQRGSVVGSSRSSADLSWSRDGRVVYYVDPVRKGVIREFSPFADVPSDVALRGDLGSVTSIADAG